MNALLSIHPSAHVGPGAKIAPGAVVGPNCVLEGNISIGARATLGAGVSIDGDAVIGTDCLIEAGVTTTAGPRGEHGAPLVLGAGVRVGAGSILTLGIKLAIGSRIEAGAVVSRDVPAYAIVKGIPASVVGFLRTEHPAVFTDGGGEAVVHSRVAGVKLYRFPQISDPPRSLTFGEFGVSPPFFPKRYFTVQGVPTSQFRGAHAHATLEELLICTAGNVSIVVDDGLLREEYILNRRNVGLYLPPLVWATQYKHSPDAVLLVFASHPYDADDYILDYEKFVCDRKRRR